MKRVRKLGQRLKQMGASVMVRLIVTYILAVVLTAALVIGVTVILVQQDIQETSPDEYIFYAEQALINYKQREFLPPRELLPAIEMDIPIGSDIRFTLVVSAQGEVVYMETYGANANPCEVGQMLADCAPNLVGLETGERFIQNPAGQQVVEVVLDALTGERAIAHIRPFQLDEILGWYVPLGLGLTTFNIPGVLPYALATSLFFGLMAIPAAVVLMWITGRPLARRLGRITQANRAFAAGDYSVRVQDSSADEVGQVARQFNDMAGALQQNVQVLRDLAQQNAALLEQAETAAIQAERMRLSRDLHDAIAQRLFSLTVSTSSLPGLIQRDQTAGVKQAEIIAGMAEQTLLDLRGLLVDLRPTIVMQQGLVGAIRQLCNEWETSHKTPVEVATIMRSEYLPPGVENTLYYVAQEALNNIAKHARAAHVSLSILQTAHDIVMSITDDGCGMQRSSDASAGHRLGIVSMRERASAMGGRMDIESEPGRGTTVLLTLPIRDGEPRPSHTTYLIDSSRTESTFG
ncbi:MAG: sensor histidine kinase [Anaerolineae bacterium]|nr:sensor histidine kinase [Anaerolineae bacterium]